MIRVRWVDPKDRPEIPKEVEGQIEERGITLFKGRATTLTEEHERAHIILGHHLHRKLTPERYVKGELDAHFYTYKKIGEPKSVLSDLRGIVITLGEFWDVSESGVVELLKVGFGNKRGVPLRWKRDMSKLEEEVRGNGN